jgi:TolB protein
LGESAGYPGQGLRGFDGPSDIFAIHDRSGDPSQWVRLTHDGWSRFPDWSPDGGRIVYVAGPPGLSRIELLDLGNGQSVRLTEIDGHYSMPRWSPDGEQIAFAAKVGNADDIFVMNADGSGMINVTRDPADDAYPSWSPDGEQLAFSSNRIGPFSDIYTLDLARGTLFRVTRQDGGVSNEQPAWSPESPQIAYCRIAETQVAAPGVYLIGTDGTHSIQLTDPRDGFTDHFVAWPRHR